MKIVISGSDANAWVCALKLKQEGHEVEVVTGLPGVAELLPGAPLAPEVASEFDLGVTLQIVGRTGVAPGGQSVQLKLREITGEVSPQDQSRWSDFVKVLNNASEIWRGLFQQDQGSQIVARWREFGRRQAMEVLRVPCQSLSELLDDWFETDLLKATLAATALRGTRQGPFAPGSAFLLLQRWARGEVFGRAKFDVERLQNLATEVGINVIKESVERYSVSRGKIQNLVTKEGREIQADHYLTSADPVTALNQQVGAVNLDPDTAGLVKHWNVRSTTVVARVSPSEKWGGAMVNFCQNLESLEKAYDPTKYGGFSDNAFAEFDSQAGLLYVQHLGGEDSGKKVEALCETFELGQIQDLHTPEQIAETYGAAGGHLFGGERALWQSYSLREQLRHPFPNLTLCGAGTGPGDYSGVSGLMAARLLAETGPHVLA